MTAPPEPEHLLDGKYKIEGLVGVGAWGEVFEGVNVRIGRRVAIKVLKSDYASNPAMVARVEREARASTLIESPHVVQVFDAGLLPDRRPYIVMEFLTGPDLSKVIRDAGGTLPIGTAVELCMQAARGLAAAHTAGIFHRDMKPSNIVVAKTKAGRDVAKIVDFGISKALDVSGEVSATQTGVVLGSPLYMSPEQARGAKTTDQRSDIYSLGLVLYECLAGQPPHYTSNNIQELFFKIALESIPSIKSVRPDVDDTLDAILQKILAKEPDHRYQTATEVEDALADWLRAHGGSPDDVGGDSTRRVRATPTMGITPTTGVTPTTAGQGLKATQPVQLSNSSGPRGSLVSDPGAMPAQHAQTGPGLMSSATQLRSQTGAPLATSRSSTPTPLAIERARSRWLYPAIGGVGLVIAIGLTSLYALQGHVGPTRDAGTTGSASLSASVSPELSASAVASVSSSATVVAVPVPVPEPVTSQAITASAEPTVAPPVTPKTAPRAAQVAVEPAKLAASVSATPSATPSARPTASVGGRTIRTDL